MFKKRNKSSNQNVRKREIEDDPEEEQTNAKRLRLLKLEQSMRKRQNGVKVSENMDAILIAKA